MYGEVLSAQATQELKARIKRAEQARRARKGKKPETSELPLGKKRRVQRSHVWPAPTKAGRRRQGATG